MGWQQQRSTDLVMSHVLHFCSQHVSLTLCSVTDLRFWGAGQNFKRALSIIIIIIIK
jgi:hypothetical protein